MAVDVTLQDEWGIVIDEALYPVGVPERLLPSVDDESYSWLRYIDPYGDTVFNQLQIKPFLAEWQRLLSICRNRSRARFSRKS